MILQTFFFYLLSWWSEYYFYYENSFFHPLVKHHIFGFSDYLATIGGLVGLIAGVSIISLIEIVFHVLCDSCSSLYSRFLPTRVYPMQRNEVLKTKNSKSFKDHLKIYFMEYVRESSIQGVPYIANEDRNFVEKLIWIFAIIASTIVCLILVKNSWENAEINPVSFGIDEKIWSAEEVI